MKARTRERNCKAGRGSPRLRAQLAPAAWLTAALLCVIAAAPAGQRDEKGGRPSELVYPAPEVTPDAAVWRTEMPPDTPKAGDVWICPADGKAMVYVPPGPFLMGSPSGQGDEDEVPRRTVYVSGFWIDRTEVTNAEFARFAAAAGYRSAAFAHDPRYQGKYNDPGQPVVGVNWQDALAYARWAGKQLPTEAEWEKAARGADGRIYPWGNEWDVGAVRRCNFDDRSSATGEGDPNAHDGYPRTAPVGIFPKGASPYGCLDMAGNVWEWCADWYDPEYYAEGPLRDPEGPETGDRRVARGGCWMYGPRYLRCAARDSANPEYRKYNYGGFRCVKRAEPEQ